MEKPIGTTDGYIDRLETMCEIALTSLKQIHENLAGSYDASGKFKRPSEDIVINCMQWSAHAFDHMRSTMPKDEEDD